MDEKPAAAVHIVRGIGRESHRDGSELGIVFRRSDRVFARRQGTEISGSERAHRRAAVRGIVFANAASRVAGRRRHSVV